MKIGIIVGGGDAQGLNPVVSSAVIYGTTLGHEFYGFIRGLEGIENMDYIKLDPNNVKGWMHVGGTFLGTRNKGRFTAKVGVESKAVIADELIESLAKSLNSLDIKVLIVLGGDGTMMSVLDLQKKGIKIIGVPKTIDNDLPLVENTFGYNTASDIISECIDRLHTTATSHGRIMFVETMGRHAGWLALRGGLSGGADAILIPEFPFSYTKLVSFLRDRMENHNGYAIVAVAEGAFAENEDLVLKESNIANSQVRLGGIAEEIISRVEMLAPKEFEMRSVVLGHIQRGGTPNQFDRNLSKIYGVGAIDLIQQKKFGHMVSILDGKLTSVKIEDLKDKIKNVTSEDVLYQTAKKLGVFLGQ